MIKKEFSEIFSKLKKIKIPKNYDLIVAIGNGGIIPALLIRNKIVIPVEIIWINFREDITNTAIRQQPKLLAKVNFDYRGKKILLVDDVANSGKTLALAKKKLSGAKHIDTFVINGKADFNLYNEPCFKFPWKA
jgi:xanthine phosphoribosyltransferase